LSSCSTSSVVATHVRARGKGSGVPVEARGASVWSVRRGKVTRGKLYQSKAEALDAVAASSRDARHTRAPGNS
jgi:ketosteroid isomerase-like protein